MDGKHFKSGPIIRSSDAALAGVTVALHFENLSRYHFAYQQQHFHQFIIPLPLVVSLFPTQSLSERALSEAFSQFFSIYTSNIISQLLAVTLIYVYVPYQQLLVTFLELYLYFGFRSFKAQLLSLVEASTSCFNLESSSFTAI